MWDVHSEETMCVRAFMCARLHTFPQNRHFLRYPLVRERTLDNRKDYCVTMNRHSKTTTHVHIEQLLI